MSFDSEYPKCCIEKKQKARKTHKCCECGGEITIGEFYIHISGIWESPMKFKICLDCFSLRKEVEEVVRKRNQYLGPGLAFEDLACEIDNLSEPYFIMKLNNICTKRKSKLRVEGKR